MLPKPDDDDLKRLAEIRDRNCVTVYANPEEWSGESMHTPGRAAESIRLVVDLLNDRAADADEVRAIEDVLRGVVSSGSANDPEAKGVALFATSDGVSVFRVGVQQRREIYVGDRFLVAPLLWAVQPAPPAMVLALSPNDVRLVRVAPQPPAAVHVAHLPRDLKSTVLLDLSGDRDTLAHLRNSEDPKERLLEFSRAVDHAIEPALAPERPLLILAAAEPIVDIYREASAYPKLLDETIAGNPDEASPHELAAAAVPILLRWRDAELDRAIHRMEELPDHELVVTDLPQIAAAAAAGAVDTVFVDPDQPALDGDVDQGGAESAGERDLVEEALRGALRSRTTVVPVGAARLPGSSRAVAILRYPFSTEAV